MTLKRDRDTSPSITSPRPTAGRARRVLANMITSLMVNAAIILAVPRASGREPVPIVLQRKHALIEGQWAPGELIEAERSMVIVVALDETAASSVISPN